MGGKGEKAEKAYEGAVGAAGGVNIRGVRLRTRCENGEEVGEKAGERVMGQVKA